MAIQVRQLIEDVLAAVQRSGAFPDRDMRALSDREEINTIILEMLTNLKHLQDEAPWLGSAASSQVALLPDGAPNLSNEALDLAASDGLECAAEADISPMAPTIERKFDVTVPQFEIEADSGSVPTSTSLTQAEIAVASKTPTPSGARSSAAISAPAPAPTAAVPVIAGTVTKVKALSPATSNAKAVGNAAASSFAPPPPPVRPSTTPMRMSSRPSVSFTLPNAKAGQPYRASIKPLSGGTALKFRQLRLPAGLALSLDESTGEVFGTATIDGEQRVDFQWSADAQIWHSGECSFFVNPDPRSLWRNIPPPTDGPFFKKDTDGRTLAGKGLRISVGSRRGRSHEHDGKFRDDDFFVDHDGASAWSLMIVCDGAGGSKFSRRGSKIACDSVGGHLMSVLRSETGQRMNAALARWNEDPDAARTIGVEFHGLFHEAAKLAVLNIEAEAASVQATAKDFSTTLLAAAVRRSEGEMFVATFWMGDGAIGVYGPKGKIRLMGTPDSGEFAGQTRFLDRAAVTDVNFSKRLRVGRYNDAAAVLLMTDGVSDPYFETDHGLADGERWDGLWERLSPELVGDEPHERLVKWLDFFTPGHHDDRTIAVLW